MPNTPTDVRLPRPDRARAAREAEAPATILLVEDDDDSREMMMEYLQSLGFRVEQASTGPEAVSQALDLARDSGRVVVVGQYTDHGTVPIHPHFQINRKHIEIRGCWGSDYSHFHRAVELADRFQHRVPWREMVSARFDLAHAGDALAQVERQAILKALIVP